MAGFDGNKSLDNKSLDNKSLPARSNAAAFASVSGRVARSAATRILTDPAMLALALKLVRTVGIKKLIPILAVGGIAAGLLMKRGRNDMPPPRR